MSMTRRVKLQQMLEKSPRDTFLNFGLAMELAKEGQTEEALAQFDRVLQIDPSYLTAYFQKGSTLSTQGVCPTLGPLLRASPPKTGRSHRKRNASDARYPRMTTLPRRLLLTLEDAEGE
jgi:tetratricopeptide (TPR) repeat protein